MAAHGASGGYVVTSGTFTAPAVAFARSVNLRLIDGPALEAMIRQAQQARRAGVQPPSGDVSQATATTPRPAAPIAAVQAPFCPTCTFDGGQAGPARSQRGTHVLELQALPGVPRHAARVARPRDSPL